MEVEAQVMRLPRYARGLQLMRFGVLAMLLQLGLAIVLAVKSLTASTQSDVMSIIDYSKYLLWTNLGAVGAMLVGTLLALVDFSKARMALGRIVVALLGFAVTLAVLLWTYRAFTQYFDAVLGDGDLGAATSDMVWVPLLTIVKDLAYTLGLLAIVRSIRQTAMANDHDGLRATADYVSKLVGGMLAGDAAYQAYGMTAGRFGFAPIGVVVGLGVLGYWVYCHWKLTKFFRASAMLVHEPHNLPAAKIVSAPESAPAQAPRSGPAPRPSVPRVASAPIIPIAAELRVAPTPRAETAPGDPPPEGPKFLK